MYRKKAWGHSSIVDPWGKVIATTDEKESTVTADIGKPALFFNLLASSKLLVRTSYCFFPLTAFHRRPMDITTHRFTHRRSERSAENASGHSCSEPKEDGCLQHITRPTLNRPAEPLALHCLDLLLTCKFNQPQEEAGGRAGV